MKAEILDIFGRPEIVNYRVNFVSLAENRYSKVLAGVFQLKMSSYSGESVLESGYLTLLPLIETLEEREAVNLVLEDLLSLPQITLPPEWAENVPMPLVPEITSAINAKRAAISALESEIVEAKRKKRELEEFKKLLYASGGELEEIFAACLERCGGTIEPAKYSQEEFLLNYQGNAYLVECKGVTKSVTLTHVRQLLDYLIKFEEEEGRSGKGILLGNAWRDLPLIDREREGRVVFPGNAISRTEANGIALVS